MDGITSSDKWKNLLLPNPFKTEYKDEIVNGNLHHIGYMSCGECDRYFGKSLSINEMINCHDECKVMKSLTAGAKSI
jgi:hypothetical protein